MMCQAFPAMNPRSTLPTFHPLRFAFLWQWFWGVHLRSSGHRIYTALPQGYFRFAFDSARRFARKILASQIIIANEQTRDTLPPSWVQTEFRNTTITERGPGDIRTGRYGRVQLPSQEEARYWLQQWREAGMPKEEVAKHKNLVRRKPPGVRE